MAIHIRTPGSSSELGIVTNKRTRIPGPLNAEERKKLPFSAFALPKARKYPIHNITHARAALSDVAQFGTATEKAQVKQAVAQRYPSIGRIK